MTPPPSHSSGGSWEEPAAAGSAHPGGARSDRADPQRAYLDSACMGRPTPAALAQARALMARIESGVTPPTDLVVELHGLYSRARGAVARAFGASPEDIALVQSTSQGLGLVAAALPLEPGDNVLVCDLEFFPPVLCWRTRCGTCDVEVRRVPTRGGRVAPDDFAPLVDARTRAVVVSSVQEVNGFRADVAALAELAHGAGAWLIVDGVQEAGCLRVDLGALGADVYCAGGHKWLRNPFGMGFLYVAPALASRLEPPFYGYFSAREPAAGWEGYLSDPRRSPFDELDFSRGMDRFELGGFGNYFGAAALALTAEDLEERGQTAVESRVLALNRRLVDGLGADRFRAAGVELRSDLELRHRSGITAFGLVGGHEEERLLGVFLRERGVFVSVRYTQGAGGVRVSPHEDCRDDDIDRLLAHLGEWVGLPSSARLGSPASPPRPASPSQPATSPQPASPPPSSSSSPRVGPKEQAGGATP